MIKKLLAYMCVIILAILAYFCIFRGITIGGFEVLSYKEVISQEKEYNNKINIYNELINKTYQTSLTNLDNAKSTFERNKKSYEDLKAYISYEDLLELTRDKQYPIEFLWIKLDLIAKNNNLGSKLNLVNSSTNTSKNLEVTLVGDYLAVKNYIYDILIDLDLQFRAENITIVQQDNGVIATFTVKNINVVM